MAIGKTFKFGKKLINISSRGIATKDTTTGEIKRHPYPWAKAPAARPAPQDSYDDQDYAPPYDDGEYDNYDEGYDEGGYDEGYADEAPARSHSLIDQTWFMILMLVVLPPLGLWLLWRSNKFELTVRSIISAVAVIWFIVILVWLFSHLGGSGDTSTPPDLPTTTPTIEATSTPEPTDIPQETPQIATETPAVQQTPEATVEANAATPQPTQGSTVYVWSTPTGANYHSDPTCQNMTNAQRVTLSVALTRGQKACPICYEQVTNTPKPTNTPLPPNMYYATPTGKYYHSDPTCSGMKSAQVISQAECIARGQAACPVCIGSVYMTDGGTYFHANSTCSGMQNARLVTISEAEQWGKLPCPECKPLAYNGGSQAPLISNEGSVASTAYWCTDNGTYYHVDKNCQGMKNAHTTTAAAAEAFGKAACPVCMYGNSAKITYYATDNGTYYHTTSDCSGMTNAPSIELATAIARGKLPCPVCAGGKVDATAAPVETADPNKPSIVSVEPQVTQAPSTTTTGTKYYSTIDGTYFHIRSDCSGMKGADEVTANDIALRKQTPCPVCIGSSGVYYSTPTGQYYHSRPTCSGMKNADIVTLAMIRERGQSACPICIGSGTGTNTGTNTGEANGSYWATPTGTYYHTNSTCSGMRNAVRVTQATAEGRGQQPCPVCIGGTATVVTTAPTATPAPSVDGSDTALYYYATDNGQYYHRNSTCSGMTGATRVSEASAIAAGKTACPVCIGTVWATDNGDYYHSYATCSGMKGASLMTVDQAELSGKAPCPVCLGGTYIYGTNLTGEQGTTVYVSAAGGGNYHIDPNCQGMSDPVVMDLHMAIASGYTRCTVCNAPEPE